MPLTLDVSNNQSLKERVYLALKNEIILGELKPGTPINIFELASKMNLSNAPIREALNILQRDGFVKLEPRKQAVVADVSSDDWDIIFKLRKLLEPYAAGIAAQKIPQDKIAELRVQLEAVLENPGDLVKYLESDRAIHAALHMYNGSQFLSDLCTNIKERAMRIKYYAKNTDSQKKIDTAIEATHEHLKILDAFEKRDSDLAAKRTLEHLTHYSKRVKLN